MDIKACKNKKILVFAGTFEGRQLAEAFAAKGWQNLSDFCVATDYGTEMLTGISGLSVLEGRKNEAEIEGLLRDGGYGMVIDATHPYAAAVSRNIRSACEKEKVSYQRLLRQRSGEKRSGVIQVSDVEKAAALLNQLDDKVLLTTGAKELAKYSSVRDKENRLVARVLPSAASIESCLAAGISSKNIVAMQGPFTRAMNLATMEQYGCTCMVTKDTGKPGGFDDKLAVLEAGYKLVVIARPIEEVGYSLTEILEKAEAFYG